MIEKSRTKLSLLLYLIVLSPSPLLCPYPRITQIDTNYNNVNSEGLKANCEKLKTIV